MKTRITLRKHRPQGFSLPEVTLALGIAAFGITTLLGLLPQGLGNIRKAGDVAAAARISQHILGALDQTQLQSTPAARRYYFDAHAIPVDPAGSHTDAVAYVAEVGPPAADVRLPGVTSSDDAFLHRIIVKLKQTPVIDYDFEQAQPASYKLYSYVVARTGK
jgi:uncharacterized protein (TIGR02598 family)